MKFSGLLFVALAALLTTRLACADDQSLQQQLNELAKRVAVLEQQVGDLSGMDNWKDPVYWQKLKKDMPAVDVKKILGKPARVEEQIFTTWYYHLTSRLHSYVWFDDGKVLGWEPPQ